jgi:hypothetical protein
MMMMMMMMTTMTTTMMMMLMMMMMMLVMVMLVLLLLTVMATTVVTLACSKMLQPALWIDCYPTTHMPCGLLRRCINRACADAGATTATTAAAASTAAAHDDNDDNDAPPPPTTTTTAGVPNGGRCRCWRACWCWGCGGVGVLLCGSATGGRTVFCTRRSRSPRLPPPRRRPRRRPLVVSTALAEERCGRWPNS